MVKQVFWKVPAGTQAEWLPADIIKGEEIES